MNTTASLCHGGEKSVQRGEKGEVDKRSLPSKQEKGKKKIREENEIGQMFELIKGYECLLPSKVSISLMCVICGKSRTAFFLFAVFPLLRRSRGRITTKRKGEEGEEKGGKRREQEKGGGWNGLKSYASYVISSCTLMFFASFCAFTSETEVSGGDRCAG